MDPVDAAIAAASKAPKAEVPLRRFQVTISSTGRPAMAILPADATDAEIGEFAGWLLTAVMNTYRAERAKRPASRILVPARA
jgi:hypothetical protein